MSIKYFFKIAAELSDLMIVKNLFLTTAESCTGGWVSKEITAIPGSSKWFGYGFVTYSNLAKIQVLGVSKKTLECYGAVSSETVKEMVSGALMVSKADIGLAISGIAGPSGGSIDRPVGTVSIAWQLKGQEAISVTEFFTGDREEVRIQTVERAFQGCLEIVKSL